jgi:hypothetical protein
MVIPLFLMAAHPLRQRAYALALRVGLAFAAAHAVAAQYNKHREAGDNKKKT